MICKKCGAEIKENTKFCGKCGTAVDTAADYVGETVKSEETVLPVKKRKKKLIAVLSGAVAVLVAVSILAVSVFGNFPNFFAKMFKSDAEYFSYVNMKETESYAEMIGNMSETDFGLNTFGREFKTSLNLTDKGKEELINLTGMDEKYIDWIDSAGIKMDFDVADGKMQYVIGAELNDVSIVEGKIIFDFDSDELLVNTPDCNKKSFKLDLPEEVSEAFKSVGKYLKSLPDKKTAEESINKYSQIVFDNIDNVKKESASLEICGVTEKCSLYTATLDSKTMCNIVREVLKALKDDETFKNMFVATYNGNSSYGYGEEFDELIDIFGSTVNKLGETAENIFDKALEKAIEQIDDDDFKNIGDIKYSSWIDSSGKIIARSLNISGKELFMGKAEDGKKFGYMLGFGDEKYRFTENDENYFYISGKGSRSGDSYSGKFTVNALGQDLLGFSLDKVNTEEARKCNFKGDIAIVPEAGLIETVYDALPYELQEQIPYKSVKQIANFVKDYKFRLSIDTEHNKKGSLSFGIVHSDDLLADLKIEMTKKDASKIIIPSDSTTRESEWLDSLKIENIKKNLQKAGMPKEFINEIF